MHEYLGGCLRALGAIPLEIGGVADHVHLLADLKPTHRLSEVLRATKKGSSEWIRGKIENFHWQDGYGAFTIRQADIPDLNKYIAGQKDHHRKRTFQEELIAFLDEDGMTYDQRYLWS